MSDRIHAHYWLETPIDPARAADTSAGEQSSGTFLALANDTPELKARSGARVEQLQLLAVVDQPSLPGRYPPGSRFSQCAPRLLFRGCAPERSIAEPCQQQAHDPTAQQPLQLLVHQHLTQPANPAA